MSKYVQQKTKKKHGLKLRVNKNKNNFFQFVSNTITRYNAP